MLVDAESGKIVTNESNEIMILLNDYARRKQDLVESAVIDLRPVDMEAELDGAVSIFNYACLQALLH